MAYNNKSSNDKDFLRASLGVAAAQICQSLGWHSVHRSSHDILTDVLERYLKQVSKTALSYSQHFSRTIPTLTDVSLAFDQLGIEVNELEDYVNQVEANPSTVNPPTLPLPAKQGLLSFEVDDQFPSIVDVNRVEEMEVEPVEAEHTAEIKDDIIDTSDDVKAARPTDLTIRKNSIESPPYSPLEPKSLNLDALVDMEMTRPGLIVTTPKGYTPIVTVQPPSLGIASVTDALTKTPSPLATSELKQPIVVLKDINQNSPSLKSNSFTAEEKKRTDSLKIPDSIQSKTKNIKKEKPPKKSPKLSNLKSPPKTKNKKRSPDILSPPRSGSHVKQKSPKKSVPVADIKDFIKMPKTSKTSTAKKDSPRIEKKKTTPKQEKDSGKGKSKTKFDKVFEIKIEPLVEPATTSVSEHITSVKIEPESDIEMEPLEKSSPLSVAPSHVVTSPPSLTKIEPNLHSPPLRPYSPPPKLKNEPVEEELSDIETTILKARSKTIMFPTRDSSPEVSLPSPPDMLNDLLSPTIRRAGYSSDAKKDAKKAAATPVRSNMFLVTTEKHSSPEQEGNITETEVDILSISQDESKSPVKPLLSSFPLSLHHGGGGEEKKKKKKKKSDRDKDIGKEERREKKEKKKKHREEKERRDREEKEKHEKEKKMEIIPKLTLPKLTLKMGGEKLESSPTNSSIKTETPDSLNNSFSPVPVIKSSSKKNKKENKHKEKEKEKDTKTSGGFYVETLTNTASTAGEDVYYCPGCNLPDDGSPMIGCDSCDLWYHWPCVSITTAPADDQQWYCPKCEPPKKKKKRKKRDS